ncbi:hypothetical protein ElyMa_006528000 [Elysia marginata]|uniref:Uncharacterized protein n=1 Tax=Elysia marginata TaxID=1093978 RepID=A0AAV4I5X3_9GAST|nr:hypothetical protein ElyMa_006528000 [Elysia marginata]
MGNTKMFDVDCAGSGPDIGDGLFMPTIVDIFLAAGVLLFVLLSFLVVSYYMGSWEDREKLLKVHKQNLPGKAKRLAKSRRQSLTIGETRFSLSSPVDPAKFLLLNKTLKDSPSQISVKKLPRRKARVKTRGERKRTSVGGGHHHKSSLTRHARRDRRLLMEKKTKQEASSRVRPLQGETMKMAKRSPAAKQRDSLSTVVSTHRRDPASRKASNATQVSLASGVSNIPLRKQSIGSQIEPEVGGVKIKTTSSGDNKKGGQGAVLHQVINGKAALPSNKDNELSDGV